MKNNKGFTLIELLVVVAIIGSLAAVGVVAYNGYTAAAKKNSSKAIHANAAKYIASELAKCALSTDSELFGSTGDSAVTCSSKPSEVVTYLVGTSSPMQDKNPYDSSKAAISEGTTTGTGDDAVTTCEEGYTCLDSEDDDAGSGGKITISTNFKEGDTPLSTDIQKE